MSDAAREEAALEEAARQRAEEIKATAEAAAQTAAADSGTSADAEIAQVHRSGRQHDHTDTAAYQRPQLGRRRGPAPVGGRDGYHARADHRPLG